MVKAQLQEEGTLPDDTTAMARAERGEPLSGPDLAAIFGIKHAQYHKRDRAGDFDRFKLNPPIGNKKYSGVLVMRYLRGEPVYEPTFGRKRGPRATRSLA